MELPNVTHFDGRASCADPAMWPIVDLVFERPGSPLGHRFRRDVCGPCPIKDQCLNEAMREYVPGVWGGTGPHTRTRAGGPRRPAAA